MSGPTRDEILAAFPLQQIIEGDGVKLIGSGVRRMALCKFHQEKTASMSVNLERGVFFCFGCQRGGSVVDWIALRDGKDPAEVLRELSAKLGNGASNGAPKGKPAEDLGEPTAVYVYRDELGQPVYRVLRYEPKTFKQQRKLAGVDAWAWGMENVQRVLYRLPEVLASKDGEPVWLTAGEKDVATLVAMKFNATTNVGGEASWSEGYVQWLEGRDVVICGDQDAPGAKWVTKVVESLDGKAKRVRVVTIPSPDKDVSDYRARFGSSEACRGAMEELLGKASVMVAGGSVPVISMVEMEDAYNALQKQSDVASYSFKDWLPTFGFKLRPCVPGDVLTFVASTGSGKTAALQNLAFTSGLPTLLFEFELSNATTFERFVSIAMKMRQSDVEAQYRAGYTPDWRATTLSNIYVSTVSGITTMEMERIIQRASLKMGRNPVLVLVDYVQLMRGSGKSRYEQMTSVASDIKSIAKNTNTIIVAASQVMRKPEDNVAVGLSDAKDSGSIENSSSLMIGLWKDKDDYSLLHMRVNKSTRDGPGLRIKCNFDGPTMRITERSRLESA